MSERMYCRWCRQDVYWDTHAPEDDCEDRCGEKRGELLKHQCGDRYRYYEKPVRGRDV